MKGFKDSTRTMPGHSFPKSHGFTHSTGGTINSYKEGGKVGNALVQRKDPPTEELKEAGGTSPLRSGFAGGGKAEKHFHVHHHYHGGKVSKAKMRKMETQGEKATGGTINQKNAGGALYAGGGKSRKMALGGIPMSGAPGNLGGAPLNPAGGALPGRMLGAVPPGPPTRPIPAPMGGLPGAGVAGRGLPMRRPMPMPMPGRGGMLARAAGGAVKPMPHKGLAKMGKKG